MYDSLLRPMTLTDPFAARFRAQTFALLEGAPLSIADTYARPLIPPLTLKGGGRSAGSDVNLQNLTFGNTAGGGTEAGRITSEATLANSVNYIDAKHPWTALGTALMAARWGLFGGGEAESGGEAGIMLGTPLFGVGTTAPSSALGTFHLYRNPIGLYAQAGVLRDPVTGQWIPAGSFNIVGTYQRGTEETGVTQFYQNFLFNAAGTGQVANTNVTNYAGFTGLLGLSYAPKSSKNTFGVEGLATLNYGQPGAPGGPLTSLTTGGLLSYQRGFGRFGAWGVAAGATYETGGGGTNVFLRFGYGLGRGTSPPLPYPAFDGAF